MGFSGFSPMLMLAVAVLLLSIHADVQAMASEVSMSAHFSQARHLMADIDCPGECGRRCSLSSRKKICVPDCLSCCKTCGCVPPGTAGNRELCSCYAKLKNSKQTGKCP